MDKSIKDNDIVFPVENFKLVVDKRHYDESMLITVDYLESPWAKGFVVKVQGSNCRSGEKI